MTMVDSVHILKVWKSTHSWLGTKKSGGVHHTWETSLELPERARLSPTESPLGKGSHCSHTGLHTSPRSHLRRYQGYDGGKERQRVRDRGRSAPDSMRAVTKVALFSSGSLQYQGSRTARRQTGRFALIWGSHFGPHHTGCWVLWTLRARFSPTEPAGMRVWASGIAS